MRQNLNLLTRFWPVLRQTKPLSAISAPGAAPPPTSRTREIKNAICAGERVATLRQQSGNAQHQNLNSSSGNRTRSDARMVQPRCSIWAAAASTGILLRLAM